MLKCPNFQISQSQKTIFNKKNTEQGQYITICIFNKKTIDKGFTDIDAKDF